ncbi:ATP-dependent DNA helicase RecG [Lactiplantibacillus plantarum]|uniref:ATP-dependent DNA helicase RecG n=1 Tax=Lactiplantibacillus plantarum TaxID=1590 RepID=UPI001BABDD48|nr:ATP-dependent DNA helicase RecG [Lactiplantibacillus plantarum]MBS0935519.1 ATP-dependent DNA helicase RecG [Lactiplantibacillus plantarum]MBS0943706.1 ATP-dependent DNA helicase RecG [Lactiplantibacillus plantarum]
MGQQLSDAVATLSGVGPARQKGLAELGINTIADLLTYYPFRYEDLQVKDVNEIADQEKVTLKGTVASEPVLARFGRKKNRLNFRLLIDHDVYMVTFFNQPYLMKQIETGQDLAVYGKWDATRSSLTGMKIINPNNADSAFGSIYPASKTVKQGTIQKMIKQAYELYAPVITDIVPANLRAKYRLLPRRQMIHDMHFPASQADSTAARRSATYEEFLLFQMQMQVLKQTDATTNGIAIAYDNDRLKAFIKTLPFELTHAQKRVVNEICLDLKSPNHMNRLLQGDVGSGKTIVAAIVMYAAITAGYQAALMAPTEILAEQHANNLAQVFADTDVNVALLTGATKPAARKTLLAALAAGEINLLIGTHALIQDGVTYANLGLVITDEQHRFGVNQRAAFRQKGGHPDALAMTATPIPRTLAITAYGEMDVSEIDELPAGRQPIQTTWVRSNQANSALSFVHQQIDNGSQAYVVTPLIEESETLDVKNAEALSANLQEYFGASVKVGLLHGRMKPEEKDAVMAAFKAGDIQLLVSTTVIEVGVDVKNATIMMIYDADRFGLAQLHQLRGRVGRGTKASYCILVADPKNQQGIERMQIMTQTTNGFVLAQKDLELRGAGDVLGVKQSGMPEFKVGDPIADLTVLQVAQQDAHAIVQQPDWQSQPDNRALAAYLSQKLAAVGTLD